MAHYEKGKKYVFTDRQFSVGRDGNNRLTFIIPDSASTAEYRIVAYDFQNQKLPEKITCYFNGTRLEQDPFSVAPQLYKVGQRQQFYMNSDVRLGRATLRDEKNNVTYKNIYVGKVKFKRFDRITCVIDEMDGETMKVTPVVDEKHEDFFTPESLLELPEARYLRKGAFYSLLERPEYAEVKRRIEESADEWVLLFLEQSLMETVYRLKGKVTRRGYILRGLESLAVALIERSDYVSRLPQKIQGRFQERLESVAQRAGDYWRAYNLMVGREADNTMHSILSSLERSARFYQPEEKVRLLSAMILLEAVDVNIYMERVLAIINTHHANPVFMHYFKPGMQQLLKLFLERRVGTLATSTRDTLRLVLRALAMEQLLAGQGNADVAERRGLLYVCAALLLNSWDNALPAKAIQCFAGLVSGPLEFSWADLDPKDISRLCYASLTRPFDPSDVRNEAAVFRGPKAMLAVTPGSLSLSPADSDPDHLKRSLTYTLFPGMAASVLTDNKVQGVSGACDGNPVNQAPRLKELALHLLRSEGSRTSRTSMSNVAVPLEAGDTVKIYVTGQNQNGEFECRIADSYYQGTGTMTVYDMVAFEVRPALSDFYKDHRPLLLEAMVREVNADGTYKFSIRRTISGYNVQKAAYDRDSETEVACVITGVYKAPKGYYALSTEGYTMVVWLPPYVNYELHRGDRVLARVLMVNSENYNLFVKAQFIDLLEPEDLEGHEDLALTPRDILRRTLLSVSNGEVYDGDMEVRVAGTEERHVITMESRAATLIVRAVNLMNSLEGNELGSAYTMNFLAWLMARTVDADSLAEVIEAKCEALEALGEFALISRIDNKTMEKLQECCEDLRKRDFALDRYMKVLKILSGLDHPDEWEPKDYNDTGVINQTVRLVSAYNQLWGLGLEEARREILKGIYTILHLPQPQEIDVERLKVQEDEHNEFKESLIYPANNNMKADDRIQGREIMEIVCGMLNHEGGTIYLGVNNQAIPVGLDADFRYLNNGSDRYDLRDIEDKFALNFHWHLRNQIGKTYEGHPVTDYVKLSFDILEGKVTGRVTVEPFPGMVRMRDGQVYIRQDSSTLPLAVKEQAKFAERRQSLGEA